MAIMHPASIIFRTVLLEEINEENSTLRQEVEHFQPLLDRMQKVEVIAPINEEPIRYVQTTRNGLNVHRPLSIEWRTIVKSSLGDGAITGSGGDARLLIPIAPLPENLLLRNLGSVAGVSVSLAGRCIGHFPHTTRSDSSNISDSIVVDILEDGGNAKLTIYVSDYVSVQGELHGLTNEDIIEFKENGTTNIRSYIHSPSSDEEIISSNLIFKPTCIVMDATPSLKDTLRLLGKAATSGENIFESDEGRSSSDELRYVTLSALGDENHMNMLRDNMRLKIQQSALRSIREKMARVTISHGDRTLMFSLEEGQLRTGKNGESIWEIDVSDKDNSLMTVNEIKDSMFSVSGIQWTKHDLLHYLRPGDAVLVGNDEIPYSGLRIPYSSGVDAIGLFNWFEHSRVELSDIADNFFNKIQAAMSNRVTLTQGAPFPSNFKVQLKLVRFHRRLIEETLEIIGLGDHLGTEAYDAVSNNGVQSKMQ